jgi:MYXO-CTERM domain-containing protein
MKNLITTASALLIASAAHAGIFGSYSDATDDLFDNGLGNLDISGVGVSDDGTNITFAVTTRSFQNWTKYMIAVDSEATAGTGTNAWGRPWDLNGPQIEHFIGSWVDAPSSNAQNVTFRSGAWDWSNYETFSNSVSGNTVSFTVSLASLGLSAGQSFSFDVGTSGGGGGDPAVDLLSRSDVATTGWGSPSVSGEFRTYTVTPTPGAIALLGLAGIAGSRRRTK